MPLSQNDQIVLAFWEQTWYLSNRLPTVRQTVKETGLSENTVSRVVHSQAFHEACSNRGIDIIPESKLLTPEQAALANSLLDFSDTATPNQKMKRLGVQPRQYSAWMKQSVFKDYLHQRSEELFSDAMPEAHAALVRNLQNGDLASIKLFYEISGRWSSKTVGELNVEFLMTKILDILYRWIKDPSVFEGIATELSALSGNPAQVSTRPVGNAFRSGLVSIPTLPEDSEDDDGSFF